MTKKQQGLTFKDLIAAQEALAAQGDERAAQQVQRLTAMHKSLTEQEQLAKQDRVMQAVQTVESVKGVKDEDKLVKSIDSLEKETKKGLLDKKGDGLNSNVLKLTKQIKESFKGIEKTLDQAGPGATKDAKGMWMNREKQDAEGAKYKEGFLGNIKRRAGDLTKLKGWVKERAPGEEAGGALDAFAQKRIAQENYVEGMNIANPNMKYLKGARKDNTGLIGGIKNKWAEHKTNQMWRGQFAGKAGKDGDVAGINDVRGEMKKAMEERKLAEAAGATPEQLKAAGRGEGGKLERSLEDKYVATASRFEKERDAFRSEAVPVKKAKVGKLDTNDIPPGATPFVYPKKPANSAAGSEEILDENNRIQSEQLSLLHQIAENTASGKENKPSLKAKDNGGGAGGGGMLEGIGKGLSGLGKGLAGLGKGIGKGIQGFLEGLSAGIKSFGSAQVLKGAAAMLVLSGALWVTADALTKFNEVDWGSILKGGVALLGLAGIAMLLGKAGPEMIIGAAAMLVLSGALWVTGEALQKFAEISWEDIAKGMVALVGLGAIGVILGMFAPAALLGAAALVALGAGLWVVGEAMQAVSEGVNGMIDGITKLGELDGGNLFKVAGGIVAIGLSLVAFAAASAAASVGNLIGNLFSLGQTSPIDQLIKIGEVGDGIQKAADGIDKLSEAIKKFAGIDTKALGSALKVLNDEFPWIKATLFAKAGAAFTVTTANATVSAGPAGKAAPASPTASGDQVAGKSSEVADAQRGEKGGTSNTSIVAPQTSIQTTNTAPVRIPARNLESSYQSYSRSRFAF